MITIGLSLGAGEDIYNELTVLDLLSGEKGTRDCTFLAFLTLVFELTSFSSSS